MRESDSDKTFVKAFDHSEDSATDIRMEDEYPLLETLVGPHQGRKFSLFQYDTDITLGRARGNAIVLEDNSISRSHCIFRFSNGQLILKDTGSRNGTYLNKEKIEEDATLQHLDEVQIGIYTLRVLFEPFEELAESEKQPSDELGDESNDKSDSVQKEKDGSEQELESEEPKNEAQDESENASQNLPESISKSGESENEEEQNKAPVKVLDLQSEGQKKKSKILPVTAVLFLLVILIGFLNREALREKYYSWTGGEPVKKNPIDSKQVKGTEGPLPIKETSHGITTVILEVASQPIRSRVFLEGKEIGLTPFKVSVQVPTDRPVKLEAHYDLIQIKEKFIERQTKTFSKQDELVTLNFGAELAEIKVKSMPKNADLYLEASFAHNNFEAKPLKINKITLGEPLHVPLGKYSLELRERVFVPGNQEPLPKMRYRRSFELNSENKAYTIDVNDEALRQFPIEIKSEPTEADVSYAGQSYGKTPFKGFLPMGNHELVLKKEGYSDYREDYQVDVNVPLKKDYRLETTAAGRYIQRGMKSIRSENYNEAIELLIQALKNKPSKKELSHIHLLLGDSFIKVKNYDQAAGYFNKAKRYSEFQYRAELGLAKVYFHTKQKGNALGYLVNVVINTQDKDLKSSALTLYSQLYPMDSVVYISSQPPGATVKVNGSIIRQATPLILSELTVGNYRVEVIKRGYLPVKIRFGLGASTIKPVVVKMKKR